MNNKMHIKKLKHCCMVIEVGKVKIVTDPGSYSIEEHEKISGATIVLITHEHQDHFHIETLRALITRTPGVSVITNDAVGEILAKEGIKHHIMKHSDSITMNGIEIDAFGKKHAIMHKTIPPVSNIGFFINKKLFFPGDAFTDPKKPVDVLALPVTAPWLKISESIDYALDLKPRIAFPVHDAGGSVFQQIFIEKILSQNGIEFIKMDGGGEFKVD